MKITKYDIKGVLMFTPKKFSDERGFFMETFSAKLFAQATGSETVFVQDNHSLSRDVGTVRGLHFQAPPHAQGKLVRCTRGRIMDVAVDVRQGSPTYGEHVKAELNAENGAQLWVPPGFLHGFATLAPDTEVQYKVTDIYAPECDGNVKWNDPDLGIDWGVDKETATLSEKDQEAPSFGKFKTPFKQ